MGYVGKNPTLPPKIFCLCMCFTGHRCACDDVQKNNVSNLDLGINRKNLDESTPDVFMKVVITHIDVLGTGT